MKTYQVNQEGYYGEFGGAFIPEILHRCVEELRNSYLRIMESDGFKQEFDTLLRDYVGRPSPLYLAKRLSEKYGCRIYLKREDLNHTGAHKINNAIGQALIAQRMGKKRIIAETGAGQHGVATATVCALLGMECVVYMGKTDVERQYVNVQRMKMLGAKVVPVTCGNMTLKDATNEAIRDWCCHPDDTYYIIGSTVGPHPYPDMVARLQSVISKEIRRQLAEHEGRDYPDYLIACIGGGSNAAGTVYHYIDDERVKSQLIMYCGVMFGVSGAVSGVRVLSTQIAKTTLKKLPQKALTKTFWYPIVKQFGKVIGIKVTKSTVAKGVSKAIPVIGGVISGGLNFASMLPMAKRLYNALDKAAFDYSEEEFENDLEIMDQMANHEIVMDAEPSAKEELKEKVSGTLKNVGAGVSGLIGKLGKKSVQSKAENPVEEIKQYKELLDMGIITQEEFDQKKKELLGL